MGNPRDANRISTLTAVSSLDGETPVNVYADPVTHRLLVQPAILSGAVAPTSTPIYIGQIYVDTVASKLYFAVGTSSDADWIIAN